MDKEKNPVTSNAVQLDSGTSPPAAPKENSTPPTKNASRKGSKGRSGAPNYSKADMTALLNIVEDVEPIGANMWALVAEKFAVWRKEESRPVRDYDSLKNKYDKLCLTKKKTGDPSCPPDVRRAKHIALDIQAKMVAMVLEEEEEDDNSNAENAAEENSSGSSTDEVDGQKTLGSKQNKLKIGAGVLCAKKKKTEDVFFEKVDAMTGYIGVIAESLQTTSKAASQGVGKECLEAEIRKEVCVVKEVLQKEVKETKAMIMDMNATLLKLFKNVADSSASEN